MKPEDISRQLQCGIGAFLARRRGVATLALAATGSMGC